MKKKWDAEYQEKNPLKTNTEMKNRAKAKSVFDNADFKDDMDEVQNFNIEALNKSIVDGTLRKSLSNKKMQKINKDEVYSFPKVDEFHPQN